jgi:hypothetical protein
MMYQSITLEVSLKPFRQLDEPYIRAVCTKIFEQWRPLLKGRREISLMLWVGDGSELTFRTLSEAVPALVLPPEEKRHQRAVGVALAAMKPGGDWDGNALVPNYLRLSQAERERLERMNT